MKQSSLFRFTAALVLGAAISYFALQSRVSATSNTCWYNGYYSLGACAETDCWFWEGVRKCYKPDPLLDAGWSGCGSCGENYD
jgi:hypothetical protein